MTNIASHQVGRRRAGYGVAWNALLLGSVIFGALWILYDQTIRPTYVPLATDIPALADGLLLAPGAHWHDWFTRGYSDFWDLYPDWPAHGREATVTDYTRPAFQFVIYLLHFIVGNDWSAYQLINCLAVAGMGAIAFQIAQTVLELRTSLSLVAAMLVVLSPPVWESWLFGVAFAIEPLATILVASAFLAILARRDFIGLALLFLAILTKENSVWAPFAAAITIILRPKADESLRRRTFMAAVMLLPVAIWLGLRFAYFGGVGGTYATTGYVPLADFMALTLRKLSHMHYLFITYKGRPGELPDRGMLHLILDRGSALIIYALLSLWALRVLPEAVKRFRSTLQETRWPTVDAVILVALWAATAFAFHFALPLSEERYATSVVVFAWPALVAEIDRRGSATLLIALAVCCILSFVRSSHRLNEWSANIARNDGYRAMDTALRQAPKDTREIYVISAENLQPANPKYVRLTLGVPAEIVRVIEINWECFNESDRVSFEHSIAHGIVSITVSLPACAHFQFFTKRFNGAIANGRLYRNHRINYELPEVYEPPLNLGRIMTVHIRPNSPARFIIEHGGPDGLAWFDTP